MKTLIVIGGPTASGKTGLAIEVARYFHTEILSADSRQCFRELNIGVAKPHHSQLEEVKHHFINSHSIHDQMSAGIYEKYGLEKLNEIFLKNDIAVCVGGTGLYIKSLCEGIDEMPEVDKQIEAEVHALYKEKGITYLQNEIKLHDVQFFQNSEIQNPHRLIRALVFKKSNGISILEYQKKAVQKREFNIQFFALDVSREKLYQQINNRVDIMMEEGLLEEAKVLYSFKDLKPLQTIGYRELFDYFENKYSYNEAVDKLKQHTRNYAKRQMNWFRHQGHFQWIEPIFQNIINHSSL
ncbi:MAG TPA: tRNA (adenosine(37)-N6)-dimethylallyltransferase MiaA [Chitinophagaceae bacterium]|nr:MAG: tRNA dimethylallyltransferase [Bacteroidetes bacterium OLB11]HMN31760.1 tRNA (adenosine(37)-N6)-dimethylallyltransferase MiaA [Chitinophagaceae bacterium]